MKTTLKLLVCLFFVLCILDGFYSVTPEPNFKHTERTYYEHLTRDYFGLDTLPDLITIRDTINAKFGKHLK